MWHRLDENKRKMVAMAVAIAVCYVAYRFSFSHAIEAYSLNGKLKREAGLQSEDAAYPHLNKKYMFYQKVLKGYEVKATEIDSKVWQEVSNMAVGQDVKVSYESDKIPSDTVAGQKLHKLQFVFKGDYPSLVQLLDNLGRTHPIGKVSSVTINSPRDVSLPSKNLEMRVSFMTLTK